MQLKHLTSGGLSEGLSESVTISVSQLLLHSAMLLHQVICSIALVFKTMKIYRL